MTMIEKAEYALEPWTVEMGNAALDVFFLSCQCYNYQYPAQIYPASLSLPKSANIKTLKAYTKVLTVDNQH